MFGQQRLVFHQKDVRPGKHAAFTHSAALNGRDSLKFHAGLIRASRPHPASQRMKPCSIQELQAHLEEALGPWVAARGMKLTPNTGGGCPPKSFGRRKQSSQSVATSQTAEGPGSSRALPEPSGGSGVVEKTWGSTVAERGAAS